MLVALDNDADRRKRVRRTALVLALVALAFYLGFIVMSVVRASRGGPAAAGQSSVAPR